MTTGVLAACFAEPTEVVCRAPVQLSQTGTSGDTITLNTGLKFIDDSVGTGAALAWCATVSIHYDAYLTDGNKYDSSHDVGQPLIFTTGLGSIIDGIEQGVVGMRTGGRRRLIIPAGLAFGPEPRRNEMGQVVVPGNSIVIYDIELVEFTQ